MWNIYRTSNKIFLNSLVYTAKPQFYIPAFCISCNFIHSLYSLGQIPIQTIKNINNSVDCFSHVSSKQVLGLPLTSIYFKCKLNIITYEEKKREFYIYSYKVLIPASIYFSCKSITSICACLANLCG
jgi:hypothetical protein